MSDDLWLIRLVDSEPPQRSDEERDALLAVHMGLLGGDLGALTTWLKAGYPLPLELRLDLIEALEGHLFGLYSLKLVKNRPGAGDALSALTKQARDDLMVEYFNDQLKRCRNRKTALSNSADRFGVGRTTVENALAKRANATAISPRLLSAQLSTKSDK
jgi:hypothetical protein